MMKRDELTSFLHPTSDSGRKSWVLDFKSSCARCRWRVKKGVRASCCDQVKNEYMWELFLKWLPVYSVIYGVAGILLGILGGIYQAIQRKKGDRYERILGSYWISVPGFLLLSHSLKGEHPDLPPLPEKTFAGLIPLALLQASIGSVVGSIFCINWGQRAGVGDVYALYGLSFGGILGMLAGVGLYRHMLTLLFDFRLTFFLTAPVPFFGTGVIGILVGGRFLQQFTILGWPLGALIGGVIWKQYFQHYGELVLKIVIGGIGVGGVLGIIAGGLRYGFSGVFSGGLRGIFVGMSASWLPIIFLPLFRLIERGVSSALGGVLSTERSG